MPASATSSPGTAARAAAGKGGSPVCRGRQVRQERLGLDRLLVHHQGAGDQVAEPLAVPCEQHADQPDPVEKRQEVDHPQQVPQQGVEETVRVSPLPDHPDVEQALAGRLPVPEPLEEDEIAVVQGEQQQAAERARPRPRRRAPGR